MALGSKIVIKPPQYFHLNNGKEIRSMGELVVTLKEIDESIFHSHVNKSKDDFSTWIRGVFKDNKLADSISKKTKKETIKILENITSKKKKNLKRNLSKKKGKRNNTSSKDVYKITVLKKEIKRRDETIFLLQKENESLREQFDAKNRKRGFFIGRAKEYINSLEEKMSKKNLQRVEKRLKDKKNELNEMENALKKRKIELNEKEKEHSRKEKELKKRFNKYEKDVKVLEKELKNLI